MLLAMTTPVLGQVSINFVPEIYGRNVDGLFNCQLINSGARQTTSLKITVTERKGGTACVIKTPDFTLLPGSNPLPVSAARNAAIQFSGTNTGQLTRMSHTFPEGDYDYCFELTPTSDSMPVEQCFSYVLAPFSELNLIDPYDQDKICDKRPLLTWQPLLPGIPGSSYQLVLAEIKDTQNPTEALQYNLPIVLQSGIYSPVLPYPSIARELENGKKYAWQVTAYKDQTILNRSEVWQFTVECQDSVKKVTSDDGYRDIEDLLKGNFYLASGEIKYILVNPYESRNLRYEIVSISEGGGKQLKKLPKIKLQNGKNKIVLNLSETGKFTSGNYYIMNLWLPNGEQRSLRFLYEDPK